MPLIIFFSSWFEDLVLVQSFWSFYPPPPPNSIKLKFGQNVHKGIYQHEKKPSSIVYEKELFWGPESKW